MVSPSLEHVIERQVVPADLAERPPGPGLAADLASVDRSRLNGHDLVTLMLARARQIAHEQAELLADMFEVAHCPPGDSDALVSRTRAVDEFAVDEIRMALRLTRRAADTALSLAMDTIQRLPRVWATLLAGEIDLPRARVLSQETSGLPDQAAREVIDQVIQAAPMLTTGQLAARIRSLAITVDPAAAQRRQERSVADRRVVSELDPDGTATLAGYRLPTARAAAAGARVDAIARAARRSGDQRSIDQLRADTFLDLLEGNPVGGHLMEGRPMDGRPMDGRPPGRTPPGRTPLGGSSLGGDRRRWSASYRWQRWGRTPGPVDDADRVVGAAGRVGRLGPGGRRGGADGRAAPAAFGLAGQCLRSTRPTTSPRTATSPTDDWPGGVRQGPRRHL